MSEAPMPYEPPTHFVPDEPAAEVDLLVPGPVPDDPDPRAYAFVSWGIWVADCPRPFCRGSEHYGFAPVSNHLGGLTREGFRCNRCGCMAESVWPEQAKDIWDLLLMRPLIETRSWMVGEDVESLIIENIEHGLMPPLLFAGDTIAIDGKLTERAREKVRTFRAELEAATREGLRPLGSAPAEIAGGH